MSTAMIVVTSVFVFLLIVLVIKMIIYPWYDGYVSHDVETTTTTTTTTTTDEGEPYKFVGQLDRQWDGNQPFVIDPHDGDKVWLNTKDTWYEDGADRLWRLK